MATRQEVFDQVVRGLRAQGWQRSVSKDDYSRDACRYRGDGGRKCAVGHLIPDSMYSPSLEGCSVYHSEVEEILKDLGLFEHQGFLAVLQDLHDSSSLPEVMEERFRTWAEAYGLTWPDD